MAHIEYMSNVSVKAKCNNFKNLPLSIAFKARWEFQKYQVKDNIEWKSIPDFPNYEISTSGIIQNKRSYAGLTRSLVQTIRNNKYFYVTLTAQNGRRIGFPVDRLMAITFMGVSYKEIGKIIHYDGIRHNNQLENLSYTLR